MALSKIFPCKEMQLEYPLVMTNIATENDHRNSGFSH